MSKRSSALQRKVGGAGSIAIPDWREVETSPEAKLGEMIDPRPDGCWIFRGNPGRYGWFKHDGHREPIVHRLVYEILVGKIPAGHVLHHECETKGCVNPEHLRPLTPSQHAVEHAAMRRGR